MTRDEEIAYHRRRAREELMRSVGDNGAGINTIHYELARRYSAKADAIKADPNWRPTLVDG